MIHCPCLMISRCVCTLILLAGWAFAVDRGEEIRLWPHGAPGSEGEKAPEVFRACQHRPAAQAVHRRTLPSIYVFLPPKDKANGMAVVIAPGGGHSQLVIDKEGYDIAAWLNQNGIGRIRVEVPPGARCRLALHRRGRCAAGRRAGHAHGAEPRRGMGRRSCPHRLHGVFGGRRSGRLDRDTLRCRQSQRRRPDRAGQLATGFRGGGVPRLQTGDHYRAEGCAADLPGLRR